MTTTLLEVNKPLPEELFKVQLPPDDKIQFLINGKVVTAEEFRGRKIGVGD